jgi:hydroxyethylthiazole kinase
MNQTANVILSIGASPVMSHSISEVEEMVSFAGALVLNIGTLWDELVDSMIKAGKIANKKSIPVILDPVGSGATRLRTESALRILNEVHISVIRGNPAEIKSITGKDAKIKGVDSIELNKIEELTEIAKKVSNRYDSVVAITGKTDIISDGKNIFLSHNGDDMLKHITGTGCSSTVSCACFMSVQKDMMIATLEGLSYYSVAAEIVGKEIKTPGSFETGLRDKLFNMTEEEYRDYFRIEEL